MWVYPVVPNVRAVDTRTLERWHLHWLVVKSAGISNFGGVSLWDGPMSLANGDYNRWSKKGFELEMTMAVKC